MKDFRIIIQTIYIIYMKEYTKFKLKFRNFYIWLFILKSDKLVN